MLRTATAQRPHAPALRGVTHFYVVLQASENLSSTCPAARGTSTIFWRTSRRARVPAGPLFRLSPHGSRGPRAQARHHPYASPPTRACCSFSSATGRAGPGDLPTTSASTPGASPLPIRDVTTRERDVRRYRRDRCACSVSKCCWSRNTAVAALRRVAALIPRKPPRPTTRWWLRDLFDGCPPYTRLCCGVCLFFYLCKMFVTTNVKSGEVVWALKAGRAGVEDSRTRSARS